MEEDKIEVLEENVPCTADQNRMIEAFRQVTGADNDGARNFLQWSLWNVEIALERFYSKMDISSRSSELSSGQDRDAIESMDAKPPVSHPKSEKARFATLAGLRTSDTPDSSDEEGAQAYYAGGSQHSGQQVLGPPSRKKDIVTDLLKSVQALGAEVVDPSKASSSNIRETFSGTGYRLGQTESDSVEVPSASAQKRSSVAVLKLWRNGFTVDDGPLRTYEGPENKFFLDSVRAGLIPHELTEGSGNQVVHMELEDRHQEIFSPFSMQKKVKPFSGQGHVLGSPTPNVVIRSKPQKSPETMDDSSETKPVEVDKSKPTTFIAVRLPEGSRLFGCFNHFHTIRDVRNFINISRPEYAHVAYSLQTALPAIQLQDELTLEEAHVVNSVVIMKLN